MRITKSQLRHIIQEELSGVMLEGEDTFVDQAWHDGREADWLDYTLDAGTAAGDWLFNFSGEDQRSTDWKNLKRGAAYVADRIASGGDPADEEAFYNQWRSEEQPVSSVRPIGTAGLPSYEEFAAKKERVASGEMGTPMRYRRIRDGVLDPPFDPPLWDPFAGDTE